MDSISVTLETSQPEITPLKSVEPENIASILSTLAISQLSEFGLKLEASLNIEEAFPKLVVFQFFILALKALIIYIKLIIKTY